MKNREVLAGLGLDLCWLAGIVLIGYGTWVLSPPHLPVVLGGLLVAFALLGTIIRARRRDAPR